MARNSRRWRIGAAVFTLINVLGGIVAAAEGEGSHTLVHVVLVIVGIYAMRRLSSGAAEEEPYVDHQLDSRMESLQQSLDAIALEVERIGESQRFMTKLAMKQSSSSPFDEASRL